MSLAESGHKSYLVRPTSRGPAPRVNRISVVAGLRETMRVGWRPMRTGSQKSSPAARDAERASQHAELASATAMQVGPRLKNKTDTPLRGMPATSTRQQKGA